MSGLARYRAAESATAAVLQSDCSEVTIHSGSIVTPFRVQCVTVVVINGLIVTPINCLLIVTNKFLCGNFCLLKESFD